MTDLLPYAEEREEYRVSAAANTDWEAATLDGLNIWVRTSRMVNLARFEPKISFGDNTALSDQLESTWTQRDWSGGMLYRDLNESSDTERYRIGNAETRYPHQLCQGPETREYVLDPEATICAPLGDFTTGGTRQFFAHADERIYRYEPTTDDYSAGPVLAAVPTEKAIAYRNKLYIPEGANGYQVWDGISGSLTAGTVGVTPICFCLWDDKLVALEHDGQLNLFDGTSWLTDTLWLDRIKLHSDHVPRKVRTWWTPNREPSIFVITDQAVYAYDPVVQTLYITGLQFPRHPDQGLAAVPWRDDNLYVSVGVGLHQLSTGGVISAVGLDRGDAALPSYLRGRIVDLEPEYNGLIAVVEGERAPLGTPPATTTIRVLEETSLYEDPVVFGAIPGTTGSPSRAGARAALYRYTGIGWHPIWEAQENIGVPTRAYVSQANDDYKLTWGYGGRLYHQPLRRSFYNPREGVRAGKDRFAEKAYLFSGQFDAQMSGFDKTADLLEVVTWPEHSGTIDVYYSTERVARAYLGQASQANHRTYLPFDPDGDGFPEGQVFRWIEFEYQLSSPARTQACLMDTAILRFIKVPLTTFSFTFDVRFADDDPGPFGTGPQEALDRLNDMASSFRFVVFKHRQRAYRGRVAQVNADLRSGLDLRSVVSLSFVQVTWAGAPW